MDSNTNRNNPIEVAKTARAAVSSLLPAQIKEQYEKCYDLFLDSNC